MVGCLKLRTRIWISKGLEKESGKDRKIERKKKRKRKN